MSLITSTPVIKRKYPRAEALAVAKELCTVLRPFCESGRLIVAGSLRRRKQEVGDVELVFVSKVAELPGEGWFEPARLVKMAHREIDLMVEHRILVKRRTAMGSEMWGEKNRFATHVASGIPVDLFATTESAWWNYVVCRTGSAESNTRIASAAQKKGWRWHPYGCGFKNAAGHWVRVDCERDVFEKVGLKYLEPWER